MLFFLFVSFDGIFASSWITFSLCFLLPASTTLVAGSPASLRAPVQKQLLSRRRPFACGAFAKSPRPAVFVCGCMCTRIQVIQPLFTL
jgi:hypothetical protein